MGSDLYRRSLECLHQLVDVDAEFRRGQFEAIRTIVEERRFALVGRALSSWGDPGGETSLGKATRPSLTPKRWNKVIENLQASGRDLKSLTNDLQVLSKPQQAQIERLLETGAAAMLDLENQLTKGIWFLTVLSDGYPTRLLALGDSAPPVVFGAGSRSLLTSGGVAIVGSRDLGRQGGEVAKALALTTVQLQRTVISGGARGADQLAMNAALAGGGAVVGVLADALDRRIRKPEVLRVLDRRVACLITQQHPATGFSAGAAFARNKLIYALADLTVVVAAANGTGGTWSGAEEALRMGLPVAVWRGDGESEGNAPLQELGALPLRSMSDLEPAIASRGGTGRQQLQIF